MTKLSVGHKAPKFSLRDGDGHAHSLKDFIGRKILLYFYPKDDTPGCTAEACALRDSFTDFADKKTMILGVSADTEKSHKKFSEKYDLPFPLLSDPEKETIKAYGAWGKKKFMGREYQGVLRMSILIDERGKIAKIYEEVKPKLHAKEVLNDLDNKKKKKASRFKPRLS